MDEALENRRSAGAVRQPSAAGRRHHRIARRTQQTNRRARAAARHSEASGNSCTTRPSGSASTTCLCETASVSKRCSSNKTGCRRSSGWRASWPTKSPASKPAWRAKTSGSATSGPAPARFRRASRVRSSSSSCRRLVRSRPPSRCSRRHGRTRSPAVRRARLPHADRIGHGRR